MAVDYSRLAADYDAARADETVDRDFWLLGLREMGDLRVGERILDLGAGTGRFARLLAESARVVALDTSREMLLASKGKMEFARARGDAHRLPFRDGTFDATVVVMVLHHVAHLKAVLREIARVSRKVVIATTDMRTRDLGILGEAFPSLVAIDRARFPRIDEIARDLEGAGFHRVRVEDRALRRSLPVAAQIERVRKKYISTLDLIPEEEFRRGLAFLERELPRRYGETFVVSGRFTFLGASK